MTVGSLESLAAIDGDKLSAFHQAWMRPRATGPRGERRRAAPDAGSVA